MSGKYTEQVAFQLTASCRPPTAGWSADGSTPRLQLDDALLNNGAMSSRHRTTPEEHARATARTKADQAMETWLNLITPPDDVQHRREAAW
jgi:hypothetical protein